LSPEQDRLLFKQCDGLAVSSKALEDETVADFFSAVSAHADEMWLLTDSGRSVQRFW